MKRVLTSRLFFGVILIFHIFFFPKMTHISLQIGCWYMPEEDAYIHSSESLQQPEYSPLVIDNEAYNPVAFTRDTSTGESVAIVVENFFPSIIICPCSDRRATLEEYNTFFENKLKYLKKSWSDDEKTVVVENDIVEARDLWGYCKEETTYFKYLFRTYKCFKAAINLFRFSPEKFPDHLSGATLYNSNLPPTIYMNILLDIDMCGFITIERKALTENNSKNTKCNKEYSCHFQDLKREYNPSTAQASFIELCYDLECNSHNDHFPSPHHKLNAVFQISVIVKKGNQTAAEWTKIIVTDQHTLLQEKDFDLCMACSEADLLLKFAQTIEKYDPDVLYGYNSDTFDLKYLFVRAEMCGVGDLFRLALSRFVDQECCLIDYTYVSTAAGENKYHKAHMLGRVNVDLMVAIQRDASKKFSSYSLNSVSKELIGESKHDISANDMFKAYQTKNSEMLGKVANYW